MKRARKKRNRKVIDYWQSYSDMLAALLLVFILIMFAAIQKMESQQDALAYQQQTIEKQRITIQSLGGDSVPNAEIAGNGGTGSEIIGVKSEIIEICVRN